MTEEAYQLLLDIFSGESLLLIVKADHLNIYDETLKIKQQIRAKYNKRYSYIHVSDNETEYLAEANLLFGEAVREVKD